MDRREYQHIINKQRLLPQQYERALKRVEHIEAELHRYGLPELILEARKLRGDDIVRDQRIVDRAWDREVEIAYLKNGGRP